MEKPNGSRTQDCKWKTELGVLWFLKSYEEIMQVRCARALERDIESWVCLGSWRECLKARFALCLKKRWNDDVPWVFEGVRCALSLYSGFF